MNLMAKESDYFLMQCQKAINSQSISYEDHNTFWSFNYGGTIHCLKEPDYTMCRYKFNSGYRITPEILMDECFRLFEKIKEFNHIKDKWVGNVAYSMYQLSHLNEIELRLDARIVNVEGIVHNSDFKDKLEELINE